MPLRETLQRSPEEWNHPTWPRRIVPICAAAGAIVFSLVGDAAGYDPSIAAGVGAGLSVIVAWIVLAALD